MTRFLIVIRYTLFLPIMAIPLLAYCLSAKSKQLLLVHDAREAYKICFPGSNDNSFIQIYRLLADIKEFRNIFYMRLGVGLLCEISKIIIPELKSFEISTDQIKGGFFVEHATSTYINANSIGENFSAKQNVTIGWNNGKPIIGNNVTIGTGAVVLGSITIGDNVKIGANAIVVDDVPANCTVCSPKATIVKRHNIPTIDVQTETYRGGQTSDYMQFSSIEITQ